MRLVLASQSETRRRLLTAAGLTFSCDPPAIDEAAVKESLRAAGAGPAEASQSLAEIKALRVAARHPGALTIGADQLLSCQGEWFDKPTDLAAAASQLAALAGRSHDLHSAVCVARDGRLLWQYRESPRLTLRPLDSATIDGYLAKAGRSVLESVGAYRIEGLGITLMQQIEGDFFAIQGLPLLPLLAFLRPYGLVPCGG